MNRLIVVVLVLGIIIRDPSNRQPPHKIPNAIAGVNQLVLLHYVTTILPYDSQRAIASLRLKDNYKLKCFLSLVDRTPRARDELFD